VAADISPVSGLAGRYAHALLELAENKKKLDTIADDLRGLRQLVSDSTEFAQLLRSPRLNRTQQENAIDAVLRKAGADAITINFARVAARNGRAMALPEMAEAYLNELARRRGEVTAQVTTAQELSDKQRQQLEQALRQSVGGKVNIESRVDPSLIGGIIVRVGSRMIDNSLRSKLNRLQHALKGAG
jgi:F-type H+-transporting ATPase subunit delta